MKLHELTAREVVDRIRKKEVSVTEVCRALFARIDDVDSTLHAYITLYQDEALERAQMLDQKLAAGEDGGLLFGLPVAIKDNLCIEGKPTTCASRILSGFTSPYDATVIQRLREAGAVFIGRTNMDEFAMGSSTETSCYGITRNPWDGERIPGGSSGGAATVLAADEAPASIGSDTGGSIRQPASHCGVVGLKPTYGRISRYGLVAYASSLDQIGPLAKDVTDIALLMNVIAGKDQLDSTSVDEPVSDHRTVLNRDIQGCKIGVPREYFVKGMDPDVEHSIRDALKVLESQGAEILEISLPHTEYAIATYYIIATAEASSNLARYDGVQYGLRSSTHKDLIDMYASTKSEGFGNEVKRRILLGTFVLSSGYYEAYYLKAQQVRNLLKTDFDRAFTRCDCIVTPVSPTPAFRIGEKVNDPLQMYLSDIFTISINLAGVPALSVPCGFSKDGLPIGLQLIGKHFDEAQILQVAHAYEQSTDWHTKRPKLDA